MTVDEQGPSAPRRCVGVVLRVDREHSGRADHHGRCRFDRLPTGTACRTVYSGPRPRVPPPPAAHQRACTREAAPRAAIRAREPLPPGQSGRPPGSPGTPASPRTRASALGASASRRRVPWSSCVPHATTFQGSTSPRAPLLGITHLRRGHLDNRCSLTRDADASYGLAARAGRGPRALHRRRPQEAPCPPADSPTASSHHRRRLRPRSRPAVRLASEGAALSLVDVSAEGLEATKAAVLEVAPDADVLTTVADVSDESQVDAYVSTREPRRIDGFFNKPASRASRTRPRFTRRSSRRSCRSTPRVFLGLEKVLGVSASRARAWSSTRERRRHPRHRHPVRYAAKARRRRPHPQLRSRVRPVRHPHQRHRSGAIWTPMSRTR